MKFKLQVDAESGAAYFAIIDPTTNEHKKSVYVEKGQEVEGTLAGITDAGNVEIGEVVGNVTEGQDQPAEGGAEEPDAPEPDAPAAEGSQKEEGDVDPLAGLTIGRIVTFREPGGGDWPAIITATSKTTGELEDSTVHLTAFCSGGSGSFPALDVRKAPEGGEIQDNTWRWPERS